MAGFITTFRPLAFFLLIGGMALGMFLAHPTSVDVPAYLIAQEDGDEGFSDGPGEGFDDADPCDACGPDETCECDDENDPSTCECVVEEVFCDRCDALPALPPSPVNGDLTITGCVQSNETFQVTHDGCLNACSENHYPPEGVCGDDSGIYSCKDHCTRADWYECAYVSGGACNEFKDWAIISQSCANFYASFIDTAGRTFDDEDIRLESDLDKHIACISQNPCVALDPSTKRSEPCENMPGETCWAADPLYNVYKNICDCCADESNSCGDGDLTGCCESSFVIRQGCTFGRCPTGFSCGGVEQNVCGCIGGSCTDDSECSGGCCTGGTCTTEGCTPPPGPGPGPGSGPGSGPGPGGGPGPGPACSDNDSCSSGCCQGGQCVVVPCLPTQIRDGCLCLPFLECPNSNECNKEPSSGQGCDDKDPLCPPNLVPKTEPGGCGDPVVCSGGCYSCVECVDDDDCSSGCCGTDNTCSTSACAVSTSSSSDDSSTDSSLDSSDDSTTSATTTSSASAVTTSAGNQICCDSEALSCTMFGSCGNPFPTMAACIAACGQASSTASLPVGICCDLGTCALGACVNPFPTMNACNAVCGITSSTISSTDSSSSVSSCVGCDETICGLGGFECWPGGPIGTLVCEENSNGCGQCVPNCPASSSTASTTSVSADSSATTVASASSEATSSERQGICCTRGSCVFGTCDDPSNTIEECEELCGDASASSQVSTTSVSSEPQSICCEDQECVVGDCDSGWETVEECLPECVPASSPPSSSSSAGQCGNGEIDPITLQRCTGGTFPSPPESSAATSQATSNQETSSARSTISGGGFWSSLPWRGEPYGYCPEGYVSACYADPRGEQGRYCEGIEFLPGSDPCRNHTGYGTCFRCPGTDTEGEYEYSWIGCEEPFVCSHKYAQGSGNRKGECVEEDLGGCVVQLNGWTCGDNVCQGRCMRCQTTGSVEQEKSVASQFRQFLASFFEAVVASLLSIFE